MEDFEVLSGKDILYEIFLEWNNDPDFYNSRLYLIFLKYKKEWPTLIELKEWKQNIFLKNLEEIGSVTELHDTLDNMDDINTLCQQLDAFSKLILNQEKEDTLKDTWELQSIKIDENLLNFYYEPPKNKVYETLNSFFCIIYEWSLGLLENII